MSDMPDSERCQPEGEPDVTRERMKVMEADLEADLEKRWTDPAKTWPDATSGFSSAS